MHTKTHEYVNGVRKQRVFPDDPKPTDTAPVLFGRLLAYLPPEPSDDADADAISTMRSDRFRIALTREHNITPIGPLKIRAEPGEIEPPLSLFTRWDSARTAGHVALAADLQGRLHRKGWRMLISPRR